MTCEPAHICGRTVLGFGAAAAVARMVAVLHQGRLASGAFPRAA